MNDVLKYALFLQKIREFFLKNKVLEVATNSLLKYPTTDSNIDSIKVKTNAKFDVKTYYLHTSPELEMKKLLARGSGDIYQICKVYRDNEIGAKNFNEFSMLEYYLLDFNHLELVENIIELLHYLGIKGVVFRFSYQQIFYKFANFDILSDFKTLKKIAKSHNLSTDFDNIADLQSLLFVHFVDENLAQFPICVIDDYSQEQSAFAKVKNGVAKRFEVYLNGVEIANGYDEITSYVEYKQRFLEQNPKINNDEFLNVLKNNPLPKCAGVAIGLSRVFEFYN